MTFLAMMIALVLERLSPLEDWLHRDGWFYSWMRQLGSLGVPDGWRLLPGVLVPCLVVHWLLEQMHPLLFGLPWIAGAVIVLLYALGRGNPGARQERYRSQCRRGDFQAAMLDEQLEGGGPAGGEELDTLEIHAGAQQSFLYQGYQDWFAVLFFFLLLGPVGALGYRLLQLACDGNKRDSKALFYADWLPVRLLAATFALAGNFVAGIDALWQGWRDSAVPAGAMLYQVALAATEDELPLTTEGTVDGHRAATQNETLMALMRRASVCWVVIISVLVILL